MQVDRIPYLPGLLRINMVRALDKQNSPQNTPLEYRFTTGALATNGILEIYSY